MVWEAAAVGKAYLRGLMRQSQAMVLGKNREVTLWRKRLTELDKVPLFRRGRALKDILSQMRVVSCCSS